MTESPVRVKKIETPEEMQSAREIRSKVFISEQNIPEFEEFDEFDTSAVHFIAFYGQVPVGTARYRETDFGIKIERFAILKEYRHKVIGTRIMQAVLKEILPLAKKIYIHAQVESKRFYEKLSFVTTGAPFMEAGIPHIKMVFLTL